MKKQRIIISIILAVVLLAVFTGCSSKIKEENIYLLASQNNNLSGENVVIEVKHDGVIVYKYDKGQETKYDGLDFGNLTFGDAGSNLQFKKEYFDNEKIELADGLAKYSATISNTSEFLGVNATDATIGIDVQIKPQKLNNIIINYTTTNNGYDFEVTITIQ